MYGFLEKLNSSLGVLEPKLNIMRGWGEEHKSPENSLLVLIIIL